MKRLMAIAAVAVAVLAVPAAADASQGSRFCGTVENGFPAVHAQGPTTCPFARNVGRAYMRSGGAAVVYAWSPVTEHLYRMRCRWIETWHSPIVRCAGGRGARVTLTS
jgi:hypothetical protein